LVVAAAAVTAASAQTTITSLSPSSTLAGSAAFTLNVFGTGFGPLMPIQWNGATQATTFVSGTHLTCTIPASLVATAGANSVRVRITAFPSTFTNTLTFTVNNPAPVLNAIAPSAVTAGVLGATITLTGSNFLPSSTVTCGGTPCSVNASTATSLTVFVPAGALAVGGTPSIVVANPSPGGGVSGPVTLTVNNPVPTLGALSPTDVVAGVGSVALTVLGSFFNAQSVVRIDGVDLATTFVATGQLNATIPAATTAAAGAHTITVFNPTPGGGVSGGLAWNVNNPFPTISSLSPSSAITGSPALTITVNGGGFLSQSVLRRNGVNLPTTFVGPTQLTTVLSAADLASPNVATITVLNPGPGGGISSSQSFTVADHPVPTIGSVSPSTIIVPGTSVTISVVGTGFDAATIVRFDGVDRPTTFVSATQVNANLSASLLATPMTAQITAFNPTPGGGVSNAFPITVLNPAPVASVLSTSIVIGGQPETIAIFGSGFVPSSTARASGVPVPTSFVSSSHLIASIPASALGAIGIVPISVQTPSPGGGISASLPLTVTGNPAPSINLLSPATITANFTGGVFSVIGSGFSVFSTVHLDGIPCTTSFNTSTTVVATVPPSLMGVPRTAAVTVVNPTPGGGVSNSASLTISAPVPVLGPITPSSILGGSSATTMTIGGSGFIPSSTVVVDGFTLPTTSISPTLIQLTLPATFLSATGQRIFRVVNPSPGGGQSAPNPVAVVGSVITSVSPATLAPLAPGSPPAVLTLTGLFPQPFALVRANGVALPSTWVSATTMTCVVDASFAPATTTGGFALTAEQTLNGLGPVCSNAVAVTVGAAGAVDNAGTVTVVPRPAAPGAEFFVRVETNVVGSALTLVADFSQTTLVPFSPLPGFDVMLGVLFGTPFPLVDGLGLFGAPADASFRADSLAGFGVPNPRGVFDLRGLVAPPVPFGVTFQLQAIYADPASPVGINVTHVNPQTL
jgi:hypothetical protein